MSEIDVPKYFIIHKDKRGNIFAIEQINPKGLFEAVTKQNEQLHRYKQAIREIKEIAEWHTTNADNEDVQEDMKQILQKISEC